MPKITRNDWKYLAEYIVDEFKRRKRGRTVFDRAIKEIDRQIAMEPDRHLKLDAYGRRDPRRNWLPEFELPLQAQSLEAITADVNSLRFPEQGAFFSAHSALTDDYLDRVENVSIVAGDKNEVPSKINQDNADQLAVGFLEHNHRQYGFRKYVDLIDAEAISYGAAVGRARMVHKSLVMDTARGLVREDRKIPILVPRSIKNTYLDDREHATMHSGFMVGQLTIFCDKLYLEDVKRQAVISDPNNMNGGWMRKALDSVEPDKNGYVELIEAEGDFVIPRKTTDNIYSPNTIVTVAMSKGDPKVVRVRFRKENYPSTLVFQYNQEKIADPYATSPLRKGMPLQKAACEFITYMIMGGSLNALPPISYDSNDPWFAENGGPIIAPGAQWPTLGDLEVHGNMSQLGDLLNVYIATVAQYEDVVGVNRSRLGAQTVSHTTAFAKNVEVQRGQARTVDYVKATNEGPMTQWLYAEYDMAKRAMKGKETFYIDAYKGWVEIEKEHLPDMAMFKVNGSATFQQELEKEQKRLQSMSTALQLDQLGIQLGQQPNINLRNTIEQVLQQGGWIDIDPLLNDDQGQITPPDNVVSLENLVGQ